MAKRKRKVGDNPDEVKNYTKLTGCRHFCNTLRPVLKEKLKPDPKEMMILLGAEWKKLTEDKQKDWRKKAELVTVNMSPVIELESTL